MFDNEHLYICFCCDSEDGTLLEFEDFSELENARCPQCGERHTLPKYYLENITENKLIDLLAELNKEADEKEIYHIWAGVDADIKGMALSETGKKKLTAELEQAAQEMDDEQREERRGEFMRGW